MTVYERGSIVLVNIKAQKKKEEVPPIKGDRLLFHTSLYRKITY